MNSWITEYSEIVALVALVAGVLLAILLRRYAMNAFLRLDVVDSRAASGNTLKYSVGFLFWILLALAVVGSLYILNSHQLSTTIDDFSAFIGNLIIAAVIMAGGQLLGMTSRIVISRLDLATTTREMIGPTLHWGAIVIAGVMALEQLQVNTTLVTQLLVAVVTVAAAAIALAFALGARDHVANLTASTELNKLHIGDRIKIGAFEGEVTDIHATSVEISTSEGHISIPGVLFVKEPLHRLPGQSS